MSFSQLRRFENSENEPPLNYVLLTIMTTFNPLFRDEFIVLNNATNKVEHYKKYSFINLFWCDLEVHFDEETMNQYRSIRDGFFVSKGMMFVSEQEQMPEFLPIYGLPCNVILDVDDAESKKRKFEKL